MKTEPLHLSQINNPKEMSVLVTKEIGADNRETLVFEDIQTQYDHYISDIYETASQNGVSERDFYALLQMARAQRNSDLGYLDIVI